MMLPEFWNESASQPRTAFLFNHLWQSTVAVLIVWLIANALRNNHARTRYRLWMIASIKFLVPFSALVSAGEWLRSIVAPTIQSSTLPAVIEQIVQPFPSSQNLVASAPVAVDHLEMLPIALLAVWTCGSLVVAIRWGRMWWEVRRAVRTGLPLGLAADVPVLSTPSTLEPGIFGFFRPVLLLPEGIEYRVSPAQLDAIVAHEMCHVRRRDNLTFAIHMVVETLFWFHPLVWWIRARLVEERELACDEAVLAAGNEAEDYAEGILNVCKFYVESPLRCVSGVSGSDLKKRILRIMSVRMGCELDFGRKLLLGLAGLVAVALPLFLGLARIAPILAQSRAEEAAAGLPKFEVATVKPNKEDDGRFMLRFSPDGVHMTGMQVQETLRIAFGVEEDRLTGVPGWAKSSRYDIDAKVDAADAPKLVGLTLAQRNAMLLPLLVDRFNLKYHHETRELPVYLLTIAKGGSKLKESKPAERSEDHGQLRKTMIGIGSLESEGGTIPTLMGALSEQVGRTIIDKTGLTGNYDFTLKWTPEVGSGPMMRGPDGGPPGGDSANASDAAGPSLFTALQEQLGLKLVPERGPVDVIVIDSIDPPSPN